MGLIDIIDQDTASAMREGETDRVKVLRLLKNSLKNEQIKLGHALTDEEAVVVLQREAKQRRDSVEAYRQGDRTDLADIETAELSIISTYLPAQLSETELVAIIDKVISEGQASDATQMGQVIGKVMNQVRGKADGSTVSRLVKERLNQAR